jgi:hypothetical protein
MNLHHAAALALVGWYLMVPPTLAETSCSGILSTLDRWMDQDAHDKACDEKSKIVNFRAPISEWHKFMPFEALAECEALRQRGSALRPSDPLFSAQCIATDDPRLKER